MPDEHEMYVYEWRVEALREISDLRNRLSNFQCRFEKLEISYNFELSAADETIKEMNLLELTLKQEIREFRKKLVEEKSDAIG